MECLLSALGCIALIPALYIVIEAVLYRQLIQPHMSEDKLAEFDEGPRVLLQPWMVQLAVLALLLFAIALVVVGGGRGP
jgi:hypothetical protein